MEEHITAIEALTRVGLAELATEWEGHERQTRVIWDGYPKPFACGHLAIYRQQTVRVAAHFCSGQVLFSWGAVELNTALIVSIDETPDVRNMCLKACWAA